MAFVFVYDETRLITMFIKLFISIFFFFMSSRVKKKNPKYILNRMFSWAFISWGTYVFLDAIVYILLPLGYVFWYVAQILYGIEYIFLFGYAFLLLNAAKIIQGGEVMLQKKKRLFFEAFVLLACAVLIITVTRATVLDLSEQIISPENLPPVQGQFTLSEGIGSLTILGSAIPLFYYGYASYLLFKVIKSAEDQKAKRPMKLMVVGILLIPVGILYFALKGVVGFYGIGSSIIGQVFFFSAPIFINAALSGKK